MSKLSERDWELVNAYHDGELTEAAMRDVLARLASDPALAAAFEEVRQVSASLATLRPDGLETAPGSRAANADRSPARTWLVGASVAAGLALAVGLSSGWLADPTASDIHAELAAQIFVAGDGAVPAAATGVSASVPDLTRANLTPVTARGLDAGHVTHYAGRNGCRLSYFEGAFGFDDSSAPSALQIEAWTTADKKHHMIVATGMDQSKFEAIAQYLKHLTRQKSTATVLAAVSEATTAATPCVG